MCGGARLHTGPGNNPFAIQRSVLKRNKTRLDYALASPALLDSITGIQYVNIMKNGFDHSAIYIDIDEGTFKKAKNPPFRVPNYLMKDPEYKKHISETIKTHE